MDLRRLHSTMANPQKGKIQDYTARLYSIKKANNSNPISESESKMICDCIL